MAPDLHAWRAMLRALAVVVLLQRTAAADPFEPPPSGPQAQEHYLRAKTLFGAKQYADAAAEFAAAYELDPGAKFLLFNLGLARRMAGACREAIDAYRAFLDAHPPDELARNARIGIGRCEQVLAQTPPPPPLAAPPAEPAAPRASEPAPRPPPAVEPAPAVRREGGRAPWYRDRRGDALVLGGVACAAAGAALYLLARGAAADTFTAPSLPSYRSSGDTARAYQTASWIAAGAGAALAVAGVVRYATRPAIAVAPVRGGAELALELRF
jgi:tetratricopeptide (TPR) repeat protein